MTDREKLTEYARQVDELLRLHKVSTRPLTPHARKAIDQQERRVADLTAQYLPREDTDLVPLPSVN